jgi:FkbM family methyltransferase
MIRPLESLIAAGLRGQLVEQRAAFVSRELLRDRRVHRYRMRANGLWVHLQHATPDVDGLDQTFYQGLFDMPPAVAAVLTALDHAPRALDLGGNIGLFGVWMFARFPEGSLLAFEPDPRNARLLSRTIDANGLRERWSLIEAAVGTKAGEVRFAAGEFGASHIASSADSGALTVPLVDLFDYVAGVDLLKIDIEGAEWEILEDARFKDVRSSVIALDYHAQGCPEDDPHSAAERLMSELGFQVQAVPQEGAAGGMLWCWRDPTTEL